MTKHSVFHKKMTMAVLAGAAVFLFSAVPFSMASAADCRGGHAAPPPPPPPPHHMQAPGPDWRGESTFAFSHRVQDMVRDGKITLDQAMKLNGEMKKFKRHPGRDHRRLMQSLPDTTGISEDTLKELFAPPQPPQKKRHSNRPDGPGRPDRPDPFMPYD